MLPLITILYYVGIGRLSNFIFYPKNYTVEWSLPSLLLSCPNIKYQLFFQYSNLQLTLNATKNRISLDNLNLDMLTPCNVDILTISPVIHTTTTKVLTDNSVTGIVSASKLNTIT